MATAPQHIPSCIRRPYGQRSDSPAWTVWHRIVLFGLPVRPSSSQSHRRPFGIAPDRAMHLLGLSKARRDRDRGHDRCNHRLSRLSFVSSYQRVTHGISMPNNGHKSVAAACRLIPLTADHSSRACPREPQRKQRYRPSRTLTENDRLLALSEPCTGHGPRHWSPQQTVG